MDCYSRMFMMILMDDPNFAMDKPDNQNHMNYWLVAWNMFFHLLGIIIPNDIHIFFRGVAQLPARLV